MSALSGIRVLELGSIGPAPFAGMLLADFGADVVRVDRLAPRAPIPGTRPHLLDRGRRSIAIDLKQPEGVEILLELVEKADVLTEGFRPGVAERLGVGPDVCHERNPRLVYGRMTGWGQSGPYAQRAGHDLNYLAVSGVLGAIGVPGEPPPPPLNLIGDFGGGGTFLALGILLALVERGRSGQGQVVDAAILDGVSVLATTVADLLAGGIWEDRRGANIMDGGAPFYRTYKTRDHRYVSVAAVEPQFYAALLERLGLDPGAWPQYERTRWAELHDVLEARFAERTREEWSRHFEAADACVAPVLSWREAAVDPQLSARQTWIEAFGVRQPAPAPRLTRTSAAVGGPAPYPGQHTHEILRELGIATEELARLAAEGVIGA
jgi:alpha-methylacyl-CoA racemase